MAYRVRGVVLPDDEVRDLYLVGDRITAEPVRDAQTIVDGGWILPGLADAHCHIGLRIGGAPVRSADEAMRLAAMDRDTGVLAIRDAGSPYPYPELDIHPHMPRLARAGRHMAPPGRYLPGVAAECDPADLVHAVTAQAKAGNGWIKLVGDWIDDHVGDLTLNWAPGAMKAAVDAAHAAGARVAAHTFSEAGAAALLSAGVDSIEHGTGLSDDHIDHMARHRIALIPTMISVATFRAIAAVAQDRLPAYAAHLRALAAGFPETVRAAYDAGVPLYIGTDAGSDISHGQIAEEMLLVHKHAGIPRADIVAAASWKARAWLGLDGIIEGGPADLTAYDADPRRDLLTVRSPKRIVLRGHVVR
jgi:imidazolonepropionase-like amidohydrolase